MITAPSCKRGPLLPPPAANSKPPESARSSSSPSAPAARKRSSGATGGRARRRGGTWRSSGGPPECFCFPFARGGPAFARAIRNLGKGKAKLAGCQRVHLPTGPTGRETPAQGRGRRPTPWGKRHPPPAAWKVARTRGMDAGPTVSRPFRPHFVVDSPPRASAFGLGPGLCSPGPLGRSRSRHFGVGPRNAWHPAKRHPAKRERYVVGTPDALVPSPRGGD